MQIFATTLTLCMHTMCENLVALGDDLDDEDFSAMLLGSLPQSYDSYLSAVTAALGVLGTKLSLDAFYAFNNR